MLYFIVNELSGKGKGKEVAEKLKAILKEKKIEYKMYITEHYAHAIELAKELSKKLDCSGLVAVGGDGTFNEVLNGMDTNVPLGLISSGSGNDFMRSFAPETTAEEQLDIILAGKVRCIDFIEVNDKRSLNVAGTGFDVDILLREKKFRKILSGSLSYFASLIVTLFCMKFRNFKITVDDNTQIETPCLLMAIANGKYFGGGLPVSVSSRVDDGILDLVFVKKMPRINIPGMLVKFLKGRISEVTKYVSTYQCKKVECEVSPTVAIQLDGELHDMPHFVCMIHSNELKVFA